MTAQPAAETGTGLPPHDMGAERIALGAMMLSPDARDEVAATLAADAYFRPAHQQIHAAIIHLRDTGAPTDPEAVLGELQRRDQVRGELDGTYLFGLVSGVPTAANGPWYARKVAECAVTRRVQAGLRRACQLAESPSFDPGEHMGMLRQIIDGATSGGTAGTAEWLADAVYPVIEGLDGPLPAGQIPPPYADLRQIVHALRPGQLVTIAARPSIGKTVVVGDFLRHAALRLGLPVAWFTLEMSRDEIITRCLAAEAVVNQEHLQEHLLDDAEWHRIKGAAEVFGSSRMLIDERGASTSAHIRSQVRAMSRTAPPALVGVDYVQLMRDPDARTRQEEVSALARGLKDMSKEFGVPVLIAAQLNRNPETRHDKRPIQADLRESGEIENSSDVIILLHREDYYEPESPRAGQMDLIVSKNRNGRTGQCTVTWQGRFCRCVDMSEELPPSEWHSGAVRRVA